MDEINTAQRIEELNGLICREPQNVEYLLERARLLYSAGIRDKALNDFLAVQRLEPENTEAREYIKLIREIFEFRYLDYYNP